MRILGRRRCSRVVDLKLGTSPLSEKNWKSNHLLMELQRQHFLLSYFKTLSVGADGVELTTSRVTAQCSTPEPPVRADSATSARLHALRLF